MGHFKTLKLIFCKFKGQFELEGQGQGHKFLKQRKTFRLSIHNEGKIHYGSKVVAFTKN